MNNQHVKGTVNQVKGRVKEEVGHATGNDKMAAKGVADRVLGSIQNGLGDLKDAVKAGVDKVLHGGSKAALVAAAIATSAMSTPVFAVDNEDSVTSETSTNPVTGTRKTSRNVKHKKTRADGTVTESNTKSQHKVGTDGATKEQVEHESTTTAPAK